MGFLVKNGRNIQIHMSKRESEAVKIAAGNLEQDLKKVFADVQVVWYIDEKSLTSAADREEGGSAVIRIKTDEIEGCLHKETYQLKVVKNELHINGNDRRGTIYGIYSFCEMLGVSPWYFFADVPVKQKTKFVIEEGYCTTEWPSVEYRGIFINDEEELEAWVQNYLKEPTIGLKAYEKIFELLLRLKANYIWPAMHVNSFNLLPDNGALAHKMGIVVGTSHCDMLMRSNNREWIPWISKKGYVDVEYDYSIEGRNREILKEYWRESVEQNQDYEVCYTLGMRGIHDSGFETRDLIGKSEEEKKKAKVDLLTKIITDQREILKDTLGHETMMTFIPYKEVLELYDNGLEIPEDMTLVWANDNYGYIRRFPGEKEQKRKGGNGIYYHNSYWAPPSMHHLFICSIPLAHTRNELQKAWNEGIRKLWVLNVGAIKPHEQEISFYLRLAWEIGKNGALTEDVEEFVEDWINKTFSGNLGKEVAQILCDFSQLTNVRKIENMDSDALSQTAYGDEAAGRIHIYEELFKKGNALYERISVEEKDAFFQIVLMRIHAAYFTNMAYYYGDRSMLMYQRGNMQAAAEYTEKSRTYEDARRKMILYYNTVMAEGKWNGIVNPEGFPPPRTAMMPACTPPIQIEGEPTMRVDIWNDNDKLEFINIAEKWIEIGNMGTGAVKVEIRSPEWLEVSVSEAEISTELRVSVKVKDIAAANNGEIVVLSLIEDKEVRVPVCVTPATEICRNCGIQNVPVEEDGLVVLEGDAYIAEESDSPDFHVIRRLGRSRGNLLEVCLDKRKNPKEADEEWFKNRIPLKYNFVTTSEGEYELEIQRFPSLDSTGRIRIGVAFDSGNIKVVESVSNDEWRGTWKKNVLNNTDRLHVKFSDVQAGVHTIEIYAVDAYFAFSRMIVYTRPRKHNNLAGVYWKQPLPVNYDVNGWCDAFYGHMELKPRFIVYATTEDDKDNCKATNMTIQAERYADTINPQWYLERGKCIFKEKDGCIHIDAACALASGEGAWFEGELWEHCAGESFGRSGFCMYVHKSELSWEDAAGAPVLHYRIVCEGGEYVIWMLSKFNDAIESYYAMGIDGELIPKEKLYARGKLWRYEAEQIYRWVPVSKVKLEKGEHVLDVYCMSSGMRFDRFYLTRGTELPPMDAEWRR